jgi:hypothetical protein
MLILFDFQLVYTNINNYLMFFVWMLDGILYVFIQNIFFIRLNTIYDYENFSSGYRRGYSGHITI